MFSKIRYENFHYPSKNLKNKMAIITGIIDQHAEEAAFNWLMRSNAVSEPHYDLADLAALDDRVEANLDGLRIAGDEGWKICKAAMDVEEPGEIFAAGVLAFEPLIAERMDSLLAAVETDDHLKRALISALGWIAFDIIAHPVKRLLSADLAFLRYIGLAAHAVHRRDPGPVLTALLTDQDPLVRTRALKAAGELGRLDLMPTVAAAMHDLDPKCRFYAARSALLLGHAPAVEVLKTQATAPGPFAQRACDLALRKMDIQTGMSWLAQLATDPTLRRIAVAGYGVLGEPGAVPWLLEAMADPETARPAGEAFSMITGLDLAYEDLETDAPEDFEAGPTEDPADANVELDPDEDLPWPAPEMIDKWWTVNRKKFKGGLRHLCGKPITPEHCRAVLASGYQRQRTAAALELALAAPDRSLFEVRAPGFRQQRDLGKGQ